MANQNAKRPAEVTIGHALAFTYFSFAYTTDGELSDEEFKTITNKVVEWYPKEDFNNALNATKEALEWISTCDNIFEELLPLLDDINNNLEDNQLKAVLEDIVAIAKADGKFVEKEQKQLELIADKFGFEFN
jgi:hypothetical protein